MQCVFIPRLPLSEYEKQIFYGARACCYQPCAAAYQSAMFHLHPHGATVRRQARY